MKNKQIKLLSMKTKMRKPLLAIVCLLSSMSVSAYDFTVDGIYYNVVSASDRTCTVTYGGESYEDGTEEYSGDIVIPSETTYNNRTLTVIGIGSYAFYKCSGLTHFTIPNSVTEIGYCAFRGCSGLTSVTIPNSVTVIGSDAFEKCSGLKKLIIENGAETLSIGANFGSPLTELYLGRNLSFSKDSPFKEISTLTEVTISNSVSSINDFMFNGCLGLKKLTIEDGTGTLNMGYGGIPYSYRCLFYDCPLTSLYLGRDLSYNQSPFTNISTLQEVTIGNLVKEIGSSAFYNCSGLTNVTIPNSVTEIGRSAFYGCSGLTSVTIPNSVTEIGSSAFHGCI